MGDKALNHGFQSRVPDFRWYEAENGDRFYFLVLFCIFIFIIFFN